MPARTVARLLLEVSNNKQRWDLRPLFTVRRRNSLQGLDSRWTRAVSWNELPNGREAGSEHHHAFEVAVSFGATPAEFTLQPPPDGCLFAYTKPTPLPGGALIISVWRDRFVCGHFDDCTDLLVVGCTCIIHEYGGVLAQFVS